MPEGEQQNQIDLLNQLKDHGGWKLVVKAMDMKIEEAVDKLRGRTEWAKDETLEMLQERADIWESLKQFPENTIAELDDKEDFKPELDPY